MLTETVGAGGLVNFGLGCLNGGYCWYWGGGQWLHSALGEVCNYLGPDTDFGSRLGCISRGDPQTVLVVVVVLTASLRGVL